MLPDTIDQFEPHRFVLNDSRGFHVGFFRFASGGGDRPLAVHWIGECGDKPSRGAMVRWLTVRRAQWQSWGRLAEAIGQDAFAIHIERMLAAEPIEPVVGTSFQKLADPCGVSFCEMLASGAGLRTEVLYVHRFASARDRERFLSVVLGNRMNDHADALTRVAYERGTAALGAMMDQLANSPKPVRERRSRVRRRIETAA